MTDSRPQKLTINATTGEQIYEDLTDEEIEEMKIFQEQEAERRAAAEVERIAAAAAKASGIAKLLALGLTEDEANALIK